MKLVVQFLWVTALLAVTASVASAHHTASCVDRREARQHARIAQGVRSDELTPAETRLESLTGDARAVGERVESVGGHVLGAYNDPLGKQPVLVAILPIESVEPTPFQRDLSQAHHRKLADVLDRTGMFLNPIIAVTAPGKGF